MKNINEMSSLELQGVMFGIDQNIAKLNQDKATVVDMWKKQSEKEAEEDAKEELDNTEVEGPNAGEVVDADVVEEPVKEEEK